MSDYQRYFQPFHIRQDVTVAPLHQFIRDQEAIQISTSLIDSVLSHPDSNLPETSSSLRNSANAVIQRLDTLLPALTSRRAKPRGRTHPYTAKQLISFVNEPPSTFDPYILLKYIPRKHLQYAEDVRPAYNGTFTRRAKLTPRNPFKRDPETFAYDYDSEAEWEFEPEEGENLDDESAADDEDMGSMMGDSGDEEDRAFLDDEDDDATGVVKNKGKPGGKRFVAPLVPMIKGVCWEIGGVQSDSILAGMRANILLCDEKGDGLQGSIDPLSAEYWVSEMPPPPAPKFDSQIVLKRVDGNGVMEVVKPSSKTKTPFPDALLGDFLKAIHGSTHNQTLLIELLKKQYSPREDLTNIDFPPQLKEGL
jgi:chromatin assembly factor 1 subunit A